MVVGDIGFSQERAQHSMEAASSQLFRGRSVSDTDIAGGYATPFLGSVPFASQSRFAVRGFFRFFSIGLQERVGGACTMVRRVPVRVHAGFFSWTTISSVI